MILGSPSGDEVVEMARLEVLSALGTGGGVLEGILSTTVEEDGASVPGALVRLDLLVERGGADVVEEVWFAAVTQGAVSTVWRHPDDPLLPGLRIVADPSSAARLIGVESDRIEVAMVAMRAGRRGMVRISQRDRRWFAKVVPPDELDGVVSRHRHIAQSGAIGVAPVFAVEAEAGIVIFDALGGKTLDTRESWPTAAEVVKLVEHLADIHLPGTLARLVPDPVRAATAILGGRSTNAREHDMAARLAAAPPGERFATVHGDLHPGQVLVDSSGHITGLVDLDEVGIGEPAADLARWLVAARLRHEFAEGPSRAHLAAIADRAMAGSAPERFAALVASLFVTASDTAWRRGATGRHVMGPRILDLAATVLERGVLGALD